MVVYNGPFHVSQKNVQRAVMKRDVTSGVHSCAILEYFSTCVNGNVYDFSRVVAASIYGIFQ